MSKVTARSFLQSWLSDNAWQITPAGTLYHATHGNTRPSDVVKRTYLDYIESNGQAGLTKSLMQDALDILIADYKVSLRDRLKGDLTCKADALTSLKAFVAAMTGREDPIDVAVVAHWCWQVKRKLYGKPVVNHIMPVLYGKQGSGKTRAITRLLAPLKDYQVSLSVAALADDRYYPKLATSLVCVLDELQGIRKTEVAKIKNVITADTLEPRQLHSHDVFSYENQCSFIGASNVPLGEQFTDTTGMRRFAELQCLDRMDWMTINEIDVAQLWAEVDERREEGYLTGQLLADLRDLQEAITAVDPFTMFLSEKYSNDDHTPQEATVTEIYNEFAAFCAASGFDPLNKGLIGKRLKALGFVGVRKRVGGVQEMVYHMAFAQTNIGMN